MNNETTSSRFRFGSKIASILLSATLLATTFTGLGSSLVTTTAEAAGSYNLADKIEDGNILHCFNWKITDITAALPEIAEAGFTSIQTSPIQPHDASGVWYWLYQPLDFTVGNDLGSESDLKALCSEADKYGIKIIVDVVANHLAGGDSGDWKPTIRGEFQNTEFFHNTQYTTGRQNVDWSNRWQVTHCNIGMPDLNSEHSRVQEVVAGFINQLKSDGVDGIRWDAAKHIGLPSEDCNFWPAVTASGLYNYGEILDGPTNSGGDNLMVEYTRYIGVTDDNYCGEITGAIRDGNTNLKSGSGKWLNRGVAANKLVYWPESHDTYCNNGWTRDLSESVMDRSFAVSGARANSQCLYLSRPFEKEHESIKYGVKGSTHFTSKQVAAVNHFHNAMVGTNEYFTTAENCFVICRGGGAVVVNAGGGGKQVTVPNGGGLVPAGEYTDEITGNKWTVTSSTMSGSIGDTGIAVFYKGGSVSVTPNGGTFTDATTTVTLNANNVSNPTYTTSEGDSGSYTDGKTITIGSKTAVGGTITVTVSGTKEDGTTATATATFTKKDKAAVVTVNVDNSVGNWSEVYAYVYKGDGASAVSMSAWPGTKMTKGSKYYTLDVTGFEDGRVIFSDGTGSASNRYPADQQPGLSIGGASMLFTMPNKWEPLPVDSKLSVSLSASKTSVKVGESVTLTATAAGATGSVSYVFKAGSTTLTSSGATATWTPTAAGATTITVTATDSSGSATASTTITVQKGDDNEPTVTSNKASGTSFSTETLDITLTLSNATGGTYSVDGGPVKTISGTSATVTIGEGKIGDSTVTVEATATGASGSKTYTFTYEKKYVKKTTSSSAGTLSSYYSTNGKGKGVKKTISVDGDISDWDSSMIIAQGTANDDPRVYRPNSMYEVPLDLYTLYGAYDDSNVYLMWEMTNVQDIVAPGDDYPISQGVLYQTMNIPFFIAVSTGKSDKMGNKAQTAAGATLWNSGISFSNPEGVNRLIAISTNGANGPYVYCGDSSGLNSVEVYGPVASATGTKKSGIQFNYGLGILSTQINGLDGAYGDKSMTNKRLIGDMCNENGMWVEFNSKGHASATMDFHYEMAIPLEELGVTASDIASSGIGVMVIMTSGKSGMDCLPYDLAMNDNADLDDSAGSQENNSFEKSDEDNITSAFARIGAGSTPIPPDPDPEPLQVNFGADKSAPQYTTTALTLKGIGYGGTAPYKYAFYVDGTQVQASSTTATYSWTPGTAKQHTIKCVITDSKGATATTEKTFTAEKKGDTPGALSASASLSASSIVAKSSVTITGSASGGTSPYQYAFYSKLSTASSFSTLKDFSTSKTTTFTPTTAGSYTIRVKVKDSTGAVATDDVNLTVTGGGDVTALSNTTTLSASKVVLGNSITVNCSATGGTKPYQYAVYYKKSSSSSYTSLQSYSTTSKVTLKPASATVYNIRVKVKDNNGTVKTKDLDLTVTAGLTNNSTLSATSITLGKSVTVTGKAAGGTSPYQYAFYLKKSTDSSYTTMQSYSTTNTMTLKPSAVGTYTVLVKIQDKAGNVARKELTLKVTAAALTNASTMSATSITLGKSVTLTGKATGGTTPYQFAYYYKKSTASSYTTLKNYSTATSAVLKPTSVGTYNVLIKVKDKAGSVARKELTLKVTAAALTNASTISATSITLGKSVTLTGKATGGTTPYQFAYYYKKSTASSYTTLKGYSTATSVTLKPTAVGTYNIVIKVKDKAGSVARKELTLKVTAAALTNASTISATSITLGQSVTLTGKATGGTTPYQFAYYYKLSTASSYTTLKGYSTATSATLKPTAAGTYNIIIKVKDKADSVARKELTLKVVKSTALTNTSKLSATSVTLGKSVTVYCSATGGTTPYQYSVSYKKASSDSYTSLQSYSTNAKVVFTPAAATTYNVLVKVKDKAGTVKYDTYTVKVTK